MDDYVLVYNQSYICNFRGWDRRTLLNNTLETKGGMLGIESGFTVSLKKENAALFRSPELARQAITRFNLKPNMCFIVRYSEAPYEL